ncbi:hypothetical protein MKW98_012828, partial [Papaver atlanticum]
RNQAHTGNSMEVVAEVAVSSGATKQDKFPGSGQEYQEGIKKSFAEEKKIQDTLMEQIQKRERAIEAERKLVLAKERLFALEAKISSLLKEKENFLSKCGGPLLIFNCSTNLSSVTAPVGTLMEEPIDNNNSKRGSCCSITM